MRLEDFRGRKGKEKIVMLTAYDYPMARILDEVGVDLILVGDSLGMAVQGCGDTRGVTMDDMEYHTRMVARGARDTPIVVDMPFNSDSTAGDALKNAKRLLDAGGHGVKIEGEKTEVIGALIANGIPVMAHLGLLPQTASVYRVTGRSPEDARKILTAAARLDRLGVFAMVLESMPAALARRITRAVGAPTIGIGAGKHCDGQVLVICDMLGLDPAFSPKYLKRYADLYGTVRQAVKDFSGEVKAGKYPDPAHTYK